MPPLHFGCHPDLGGGAIVKKSYDELRKNLGKSPTYEKFTKS